MLSKRESGSAATEIKRQNWRVQFWNLIIVVGNSLWHKFPVVLQCTIQYNTNVGDKVAVNASTMTAVKHCNGGEWREPQLKLTWCIFAVKSIIDELIAQLYLKH